MTRELTAIIAYIDPGTGSIVLQTILAGVLATGIAFRRYLKWPLNLILGRRKTNSQTDPSQHPRVANMEAAQD